MNCATDVWHTTSKKHSLIPPKILETKLPTACGLEGSGTPPRAARRASGLKAWEERGVEGREEGRGERRGGERGGEGMERVGRDINSVWAC